MQPQQPDVTVTEAVKKPESPVKTLYDKVFGCAVGRWICSVTAMGLAAGIISKHPGPKMLIAAAFNIAVGSLHFFLIIGPSVGPRAPGDPRPQIWNSVLLGISTPLWLAACVLMFVFHELDDDKYEILKNDKRGLGFIKDVAGSTSAMLENISTACGCMGVCVVLLNLIQLYYIVKIYHGNFSEDDIREGYIQMHEVEKKADKSDNA